MRHSAWIAILGSLCLSLVQTARAEEMIPIFRSYECGFDAFLPKHGSVRCEVEGLFGISPPTVGATFHLECEAYGATIYSLHDDFAGVSQIGTLVTFTGEESGRIARIDIAGFGDEFAPGTYTTHLVIDGGDPYEGSCTFVAAAPPASR